MRAYEFINQLTEAVINPNTFSSRNPHYYRNLINLIKNNSEVIVTTKLGAKTVKFSPEAVSMLEKIWNPSGLDPTEVATDNQIAQMKKVKLPAGDGNSYQINQIEKTKDIMQKLGETGEVKNSKWWNKGNVAEGIMSCAVVAKFVSEGGIVTANDVIRTVQKLSGSELETSAYGKKLKLKVILSKNDYKALMLSATNKPEFDKFDKSDEIYKLYRDTAEYVNESKNVVTALEKVKNAEDNDIISVTADGATHEAQHSTKADLWIAVNEKKERLLSIKTATVKHIGAVSGYEFNHINNFFLSTVNIPLPEEYKKLFKSPPPSLPKGWKKGDPIPPGYEKMSREERRATISLTRLQNYATGTKKAYQYIYDQIKKLTAGPTDKGEYNFVKTVTEGVIHHATLGEDVRLVIISPSAKKAYTELEFGPKLYEALQNYDLEPVLNLDGANYKLLVYGYPKTEIAKRVQNDKSMFVQLRSYIQDNAARNVVEIGGLLKNLTDVSKLETPETTSSDNSSSEINTIKKNAGLSQPQKPSEVPVEPNPQ